MGGGVRQDFSLKCAMLMPKFAAPPTLPSAISSICWCGIKINYKREAVFEAAGLMAAIKDGRDNNNNKKKGGWGRGKAVQRVTLLLSKPQLKKNPKIIVK